MSTNITLPQIKEPYQWLESLPSYQRKLLNELLESSSPEEAAIIWLDASTEYNSPFSTGDSNKKYFDFFSQEIRRLLCGDAQYSTDRKEIEKIIQSNGTKEAFVSSISALIGAKLGLATAFIAPAVVLILITISKISVNAWCEMHKEDSK